MGQASEMAIRIADEVKKRSERDHYRLVLNEDRVPEALGSKIGGKPYWPVDKEYPVDEQGKPMLMLMQTVSICDELTITPDGTLSWKQGN